MGMDGSGLSYLSEDLYFIGTTVSWGSGSETCDNSTGVLHGELVYSPKKSSQSQEFKVIYTKQKIPRPPSPLGQDRDPEWG